MGLVTFILPTSFKSTENDQWTGRKKKIKKWKYEEQMQFLKPHLQERETSTNLGDETENGAQDDEAEVDDAEITPAAHCSSICPLLVACWLNCTALISDSQLRPGAGNCSSCARVPQVSLLYGGHEVSAGFSELCLVCYSK
jgi:hypothetical protein